MSPHAAPLSPAAPTADLLRWPVAGRVLRARHFRTVAQIALLIVAVAPLGGGVGELAIGEGCAAVDCIKGRAAAPDLKGGRTTTGASVRPGTGGAVVPAGPTAVAQRGCELALFQPLKVGNLDCTFC